MKTAETTNVAVAEEAVAAIPALSPEQVALYREMIAAGIAVGRKKSRTNPKMDSFILSYSRGVATFDLMQTVACIDKAAAFLKQLIEEKRTVIVLGSQPTARDFVLEFAMKRGFFHVKNRWLGGILTNFNTISKRIVYFTKLKADKAAGELTKYTKKEQLNFDRLISNMTVSFAGLEGITALPAAVFVVDAAAHEIAVREARRLKIPLIAIMNSDNDPDGVTYPIPANDNSRASLLWIFKRLDEKIGS